MSAAPAALAGLSRKGAIAPGNDADFAVLAPEATFTVDPAALHHRNRITAYAGRTLHGVVRSTWFAPTTAYEVEFHPIGLDNQTRALLLAEQVQVEDGPLFDERRMALAR
jgi:cytosine/adenosine deaminase-related metal-dependent hydrolase